jgi:hypothetical protein
MVWMIHLTTRLGHGIAAGIPLISLLHDRPRTTAPPPRKPTAPHRPMGQDGRLSADGKTSRPQKNPSSLHAPDPNNTTNRRSNIPSWPGPTLNGAQFTGSSYATASSLPMQHYILNRPILHPITKPTSLSLIFHGYMTSLLRLTMHLQHSLLLTDTSTTA